MTPDGALRGWVGGACTEPTVVREALAALADGEARLVKVEGGCASEGTIEVLVEPQLPAPLLAVIGDGPAARTLAELAGTIGWRVSTELGGGADAVVVASMGQGDENALEVALAGDAGYVGLVASAKRGRPCSPISEPRRRRGDARPDPLPRRPRPRSLEPGGDRGRDPGRARRLAPHQARRDGELIQAVEPIEAIDPVCGMTVSIAGAHETAVHEGHTYYFCGAGCRKRFEADPARYLTTA